MEEQEFRLNLSFFGHNEDNWAHKSVDDQIEGGYVVWKFITQQVMNLFDLTFSYLLYIFQTTKDNEKYKGSSIGKKAGAFWKGVPWGGL